MDIIDQNDKIIVVDNDDNAEVIIIENNTLIYEDRIDMPTYQYAVENTDYDSSIKSEAYVEWPIKFTRVHHLEDSLWNPALNAIKQKIKDDEIAEDIFRHKMNSNIKTESIQLETEWILYENGKSELDSVYYNDRKFTDESD